MKGEWIDILEKYPELGQGVLIATNTGLITVGYRRSKLNGRSFDWQLFGSLEFLGLSEHDFITHWMPLPPSPDFNLKGKSEEDYLFPKKINPND